MPDIVVISDTEEIVIGSDSDSDSGDEKYDDGISFIGQTQAQPRIIQAGPSTRPAPISIFIDSDDDDEQHGKMSEEEQDLHAYLDSLEETLTDDAAVKAKPKPRTNMAKSTSKSRKTPSPRSGSRPLITSNTSTGISVIVDADVDMEVQLVKTIKVDRKGKGKAIIQDEASTDARSGNGVAAVDERSLEDLKADFERFESSILSDLDSRTVKDFSSSTIETREIESSIRPIDNVKEKHKGKTKRKEQGKDPEKNIEKDREGGTETQVKKKRKSSVASDVARNSEEASRSADGTTSSSGKRPKTDEGDATKKLSKEEKEALKAREKVEKQLAKDTAKAAKEAEKSYQRKLAEVNRLRTSKNDTVREIHLYLSSDLALPTSPISGALPEIKTRIKDNMSELHFMTEDESPIPGVIRFKRHLKARWDATKKQFIPLNESRWVWESTILLIINAEEIVDKISPGIEEETLSTWASDVRLTLGLGQKDQIIMMIKGLQKYYSKSKSLANKEFTAAARASLTNGQSQGHGGRSLASTGSSVQIGGRVDKVTVEMELVKLQVKERCFLVHVEKTEDIEDWVYNIAADVALRPYKLISKSHLNFCPTDGIRKKSSNPTEAFELMLQEVTGITPSAAMGIAVEYPTFKELMVAFEKAERRGGAERAEGMLQDCQIKTLRNGTANGRKLNKALAKRVYNVFRGEDSLALV